MGSFAQTVAHSGRSPRGAAQNVPRLPRALVTNGSQRRCPKMNRTRPEKSILATGSSRRRRLCPNNVKFKPMRRLLALPYWLTIARLASSPGRSTPTSKRKLVSQPNQSINQPTDHAIDQSNCFCRATAFLQASREEPLNGVLCANRGAFWTQPARSCAERASVTTRVGN